MLLPFRENNNDLNVIFYDPPKNNTSRNNIL